MKLKTWYENNSNTIWALIIAGTVISFIASAILTGNAIDEKTQNEHNNFYYKHHCVRSNYIPDGVGQAIITYKCDNGIYTWRDMKEPK